MKKQKKGFVIILVLAVLVLLAMLSITYIKLALIDRNIARNYMDNKRAKLIAQSGIEYAIGRIQGTTHEDLFDTSWVALGDQKTITINGRNTEYTESSGSTYGQNRDIFAVTAKDCQSMINVNDGLGLPATTAAQAGNPRVRDNTKRILNVLGSVLGISTLGDRIIDNRPAQGYTSKQELLKVINATEFETIKNLVTTHAWQDANVANPVPLSQQMINANYASGDPVYPVKYNQNIGIYRYGRGIDASGNPISGELAFAPEFADPSLLDQTVFGSYGVYGLDELNPQWIEIVSRSPVNINQADENILITLLKDLKGFYLSDKKRDSPQAYYCYSIRLRYIYPLTGGLNYAPGIISTRGIFNDELGFLYSTEALDYDPALASGLAKTIAQKIINCREKQAEYADSAVPLLWFRGPFKTWRQFSAFLDDLVQRGIIQDTRNIYYEYRDTYDCSTAVFSSQLVSSGIALSIAHQAKADVLKANFNPNLHLNELNPDANIKTLVDKTDLIVNSTEFCFTPMGYFQIESEGFILKANNLDNIVIANSKIDAVVKLYDAYRETNQKQFLGQSLQEAIPYTITNTNNGRTLEIGPEPSFVLESEAKKNEYSGYVILPTYTNQMIFDTVRAHYKNSFNLDDHRSNQPAVIKTVNAADRTETGPGPYEYGRNRGNGTTNTLAKSYRDQDGLTKYYYAPSDFRIDGAYLERHSGLAYSLDSNVFKDQGIACYWVKPSFYPETAGKPRSYLNLSYAPTTSTQVVFDPYISPYGSFDPGSYPVVNTYSVNSGNPIFFANYYLPAQGSTIYANEPPDQGTSAGDKPPPPLPYMNDNLNCYYPTTAPGVTKISPFYRTNSMLFCFSDLRIYLKGVTNKYYQVNIEHGYGQITPTLNHNYHNDGKLTYFRSGQWIHITFRWNLPGHYVGKIGETTPPDSHTDPPPVEIFINGKKISDTADLPGHPNQNFYVSAPTIISATQKLHIGPAGLLSQMADQTRNWSADSTIDEFNSYDTPALLPNILMFYNNFGRYFRPSSTYPSVFISGSLSMLQKQKLEPDRTTIGEPPGASGSTTTLPSGKIKILGLSWTYYDEAVDADGNPIIRNYKTYESQTPIIVRLAVSILKNYNPSTKTSEAEYGPFNQDGYSSVDTEITSTDQYKYRVTFGEIVDPSNTVLLYSPVFDDITIYYTRGVEFVSYSYLE